MEVPMSKSSETTTSEIVIHLARPGVAAQEYHLPEGATLADFLKSAGLSSTDPQIYIQGVPIEETLRLRDGEVVTIVPRSSVKGNEPWRATIPAFRDNALFEEYMDILKANRQKEYPEEDSTE
jgi:hypothetical protein